MPRLQENSWAGRQEGEVVVEIPLYHSCLIQVGGPPVPWNSSTSHPPLIQEWRDMVHLPEARARQALRAARTAALL